MLQPNGLYGELFFGRLSYGRPHQHVIIECPLASWLAEPPVAAALPVALLRDAPTGFRSLWEWAVSRRTSMRPCFWTERAPHRALTRDMRDLTQRGHHGRPSDAQGKLELYIDLPAGANDHTLPDKAPPRNALARVANKRHLFVEERQDLHLSWPLAENSSTLGLGSRGFLMSTHA